MRQRISAPCRATATAPVSTSGRKRPSDRPPSIAIRVISALEAGEEGAPAAPSTFAVGAPAPEAIVSLGAVATIREVRGEVGHASATSCLRRSRPRRPANRGLVGRRGLSLRGIVASRTSAALRPRRETVGDYRCR